MNRKLILLFSGLFFFAAPAFSQSLLEQQKSVMDSLNMELASARYDSTKVRLRYYQGFKLRIKRKTFWDSLIADARLHGYTIYEIRALSRLGFYLTISENHPKTLQYLEESYQLAESKGLKAEMHTPIHNLVQYYIKLNNTKKALDYCYKGIDISEQLNDRRSVVSFLSLMGTVFFMTEDFKKAIKTHHDCFMQAERSGLREECAWALLDLGTDYRHAGDEANATKYYLMSARYADMSVVSDLTASIWSSVGAAYEMKKMPDSAVFYFQKGYEHYKQLGNRQGLVSATVLISENYLNRGNTRAALKYAMTAYELMDAMGFRIQLPPLAKLIKNIYLKDGNYKEAFKWYEVFIANKDSVANEKSRKEALEKQFSHNIEKKENENKLLVNQNQLQALQLSQSRYFIYGLALLLLLVLLIAFLVVRQSRLKAEKQTSDLEQKLLRTQMNPHFIYNSLQAIQNFILKHDEKEAVRYLSSFASVTRNVLENSRMEAIPIQKELSLLENYLQLQKLRFGSRFEYQIRVDDKIDRELLIVPPMLSQPFIENAIEHGMHDIESGGQINISYYTEEDYLVIEVWDNGNGMQYADLAARKHKPLALEITKERIALLNKKAKKKMSFSIGEAIPGQAERKGVKVKFKLPLELLK